MPAIINKRDKKMALYQPPPDQMPGTKPPKPAGGAMLQQRHRPPVNTVSTGPAPIGPRQQPGRKQPPMQRPPTVATGPVPVPRQPRVVTGGHPRVVTGQPAVGGVVAPPQPSMVGGDGDWKNPANYPGGVMPSANWGGGWSSVTPGGGGNFIGTGAAPVPGGNTVSSGPALLTPSARARWEDAGGRPVSDYIGGGSPGSGLPASGPGSMASYLPGPGGGGGQKPEPPPISPGGDWRDYSTPGPGGWGVPPGAGGNMNKPIPGNMPVPRPSTPRPATPPSGTRPPAGTGTGRTDSLWANPGGHKGVARFQKQYGTGADAKKQWMKARSDWQAKRRGGKPAQPVKPGLPAGRTDPRPVEEQPVAPGDANKPRNPPPGGRRGGGGALGGRG